MTKETKEQKERRLMRIIESGKQVSSEDADWFWENSIDYHDLSGRSYSGDPEEEEKK